MSKMIFLKGCLLTLCMFCMGELFSYSPQQHTLSPQVIQADKSKQIADASDNSQLNKQPKISNPMDKTLINFASYLDLEVQQKTNDCMRVFGDKKICDCLSEELPLGMTIVQYVYLMTLSNDQLKKIYLSNDDKLTKMLSNADEARRICVSK